MKKKLAISLIILTLLFLGICFAILFTYIFDDQDACLDSGVCKEGLTLRMNDGQEIIINKVTCKQYNGEWREKYNDCYFKE